jgi:hypothetical protein
MKPKRHASLVILASLLVGALAIPSIAAAQAVTGTIDGVARDPDGLPIPRVQVVANSPALPQRDLTSHTDGSGYYRLQLLPPGEYSIVFRLQNFQTLGRTGLIVQAGRTTTVHANLEPAQVEATVTVTGDYPVIDQRSAKLAFNYESELSENIPTSRDFHGLVTTTPGVESAGNYGVFTPGNMDVNNVLGSGAFGNYYSLDGANTTNAAGHWNNAALFSYDVIQEVEILKAAKPAEVGYQGGLFNVVTKSGGNQFSGEIGGYFQNDSLQGENASDALIGSGVQTTNKLKDQYELTASMGGRFVRDKLWWYGSARRQDGSSTLFGFPVDISNEINAVFGKLTYQANPNHRVTTMVSRWDQEVSHFFFAFPAALAGDEEASVFRPIHGDTYTAQWSGIFGDNVLAEASISRTEQGLDQLFQPNAGVAEIDLATGKRFRNSGEGSRDQDFDFWSYRMSLSWFVPDAAGRHNFKFGTEIWPSTTSIVFDDFGDHRLNFVAGNPRTVRFLNTPSHAIWNNDTVSVYAQDSWSIGDRLTLNYGLRFDHSVASTPEQIAGGGDFAGTALAQRFPQLERTVLPPTDLIDWSNWAPRFAAVYTVDEDGRTVLRGGASRYYHRLRAFDLFVSNPAFPFNFITLWIDSNGDRQFQVGEDGRLLAQFGGLLNPVDPDIQRPYTDELIAGVSHEPLDGVQLGANFIYRKDKRLTNLVDIGVSSDSYTPTDVDDPGDDGVLGTADDAVITVFAQDPDTLGQERNLLTNPPGDDRTYTGLEITATKRMSNRWQAVGSLVVSRMEVIKPVDHATTTPLFEDPNALINAKGLDPSNQPVQLKLQGSYVAPYDIVVSGFYRFLRGLPYTRELLVEGLPQGPFNVFAEPRGSRNTDNSSILDFRVEKRFELSRQYRLGLILDVFNLTNASPVVAEGNLTGANLGEPLTIWNPRIARIGVRLTW